MLKKLIAAGALSLGMLAAGTAAPALAGTDIDIGIGLGGGYSKPAPRYYGGGRISCRQGARIVASEGFRRVRPIDCDGKEYTYQGLRRGDLYRIEVRSRNGNIRKIDRIRRGGGGGWGDDYDDDYDDY